MKTVVITGGTRGLGYEMAVRFLKRGFNVVVCGKSRESVDAAQKRLEGIGSSGNVLAVVCDVSVLSEVEELACEAERAFGKTDIWINNAGINQSYRYAWEIDESETDMLLHTDLKGTVNGSCTAVRKMIKYGGGAVYNVEGLGSNDSFQPCFALYGTTKRAVTYFTDALSKELKEKGIPVIAGKLSPGIMITDFLESSKGETGSQPLSDKLKKVYNILGDRPGDVAEFFVERIINNRKNGVRITWLTNAKAAFRFMTAGFKKRDFFSK